MAHTPTHKQPHTALRRASSRRRLKGQRFSPRLRQAFLSAVFEMPSFLAAATSGMLAMLSRISGVSFTCVCMHVSIIHASMKVKGKSARAQERIESAQTRGEREGGREEERKGGREEGRKRRREEGREEGREGGKEVGAKEGKYESRKVGK